MKKSVLRPAVAFSLLATGIRFICWGFFQLDQSRWALWGLTFDPVSIWLADALNFMVFRGEKLTPTAVQSGIYDVVLIVGFGVEILLLSVLLLWAWGRRHGNGRSGGDH